MPCAIKASGLHVVHHVANGISNRTMRIPEEILLARLPSGCPCELKPPSFWPVEDKDSSRDAGGWYRPILKPCILAGEDELRASWQCCGGGVELGYAERMLVRSIVSVVLDSRAGTCQVGRRTIACYQFLERLAWK